MDSFELNKILGALLGTCILLLVTSFAAGAIFTPKPLEKPGFEIAVKEAAHGGAAEAAAAPWCENPRKSRDDRARSMRRISLAAS